MKVWLVRAYLDAMRCDDKITASREESNTGKVNRTRLRRPDEARDRGCLYKNV